MRTLERPWGYVLYLMQKDEQNQEANTSAFSACACEDARFTRVGPEQTLRACTQVVAFGQGYIHAHAVKRHTKREPK